MNSESPNINKRGWTKEEDNKLFLLAKKYKAHNWETVATELNVSKFHASSVLMLVLDRQNSSTVFQKIPTKS